MKGEKLVLVAFSHRCQRMRGIENVGRIASHFSLSRIITGLNPPVTDEDDYDIDESMTIVPFTFWCGTLYVVLKIGSRIKI